MVATKDIDIAGMIIENETKVAKCTIPTDKGSIKVPAHGYKLLWADKKPDLGPLHLNFKLGATASEKLVLRTVYLGREVELSTLTYTPHATDESYGRVSDGATAMKLFGICTDEQGHETISATPLAANGSVVCPGSVMVDEPVADCVQVYAQGKTVYVLNAQGRDVRIYSMLGDAVANQKAESDSFAVSVPTAGVYLVKVGQTCWKIVAE